MRLLRPDLTVPQLKVVLRASVVALGVAAVILALTVQSVQALWFLTSDRVFVLLFPQLVSALFDTKANLPGSVTAFVVSLILRLGGGEPLFGIPPLFPDPELFPFRIVAAAAGLVLLPVASRVTLRWSAPCSLRNVASDEAALIEAGRRGPLRDLHT